MKDFRRILHAAVTERDHPWCLATLVKTEGSSYRQPGARLLVHSDSRVTFGFLSGGCLEEEIAEQGVAVIADGVPRLIFFDMNRMFGCDGRLSIYLERIPASGAAGNFLTQVAERIARRALCRVAVPYVRGEPSRLLPDNDLVVERDGIFLQTVALPPRLLVFGDGPEAGPLVSFAGGLGWICHRYSHQDELPGDFVADGATAAVVMTHNFGRDLAAMDRLFPLNFPYIGLLGPRRRQQELLSRFSDFRGGGVPLEWLETLHSPAGLDTGSESPEEIAFSIVAEVAAVLAGRKGGFLREKTQTIHQLEASA